jgi:cobalt-zinc-cadmium efflux system outer membrane protein
VDALHAARRAVRVLLALLAGSAVAAVAAASDGIQPAAPTPAGRRSPFTLGDALARAHESSPRLAAAAAIVAAAREAERFAAAWPNPLLDLSTENWGAPDSLPLDVFALVSQPLEVGGRRRARRETAVAETRAAGAVFDEARQRLALDTLDAYLAALRAREIVGLLADQRREAADIASLVRRRVEEGAAPEAELRKFEAEVARIDTLTLRASIDARQAESALSVLTGEPMDGLAARLVAPPRPAIPAEGGDLDAAIARRADVRAADRRADAASARVALERARARPDLRATGGYKRTADVNTGVAALFVSLPFSERNQVAIARATGEARAARLEADQVRREARAAIAVLTSAARALEARAAAAQAELVAPAAVVRVAARSAFREGGGDVLRLVDAERVYAEARREVLDLELDAFRAATRARIARGEEPLP